MSGLDRPAATLEIQGEQRCRLLGPISFDTVGALLAEGEEAVRGGRIAVIDLAGVTVGDSAGLALLIEWLSIARSVGRPLRYEHAPAQLRQLARLSEVEPLLLAGEDPAVTAQAAGDLAVLRPDRPEAPRP